MSDRESTQVGYRLRIQPTDLSTYPDRAKLVWFDLVVKYGLIAKDKDLAKGLGADGRPMKALHPKTIKYRKSEVGPVTKTAPPLIPALELSRVRSLLTGRAHTGSAEFWWKFDSVSGDSFAVILRYQRDEYGRDVFGLSPRGTAWTLTKAMADWEAWKASPEAGRLTAGRPGIPAARQVRKPVPKVTVRQNLEYSELFPGARPLIEKAIAEGRFPGFRRLNARGEQWRPQRGIGPEPMPPPAPKPEPKPKPAPKPTPPPPKPRPVASPVSAALDLKSATPNVASAAKVVLNAIDKVHGDGNLPEISILNETTNTYLGSLTVTKTGKVIMMQIRENGRKVHETIVHETGHFLDYGGIPRTKPTFGEERNFRAEELFKDFFKAVDSSSSIKTLISRLTQKSVLKTEGALTSPYEVDRKHVEYLLHENEVWARAYSQWIAYRSGQPELLTDLEKTLSDSFHQIYPTQWNASDFYAIGQAMDAIFSKLGWLR